MVESFSLTYPAHDAVRGKDERSFLSQLFLSFIDPEILCNYQYHPSSYLRLDHLHNFSICFDLLICAWSLPHYSHLQ